MEKALQERERNALDLVDKLNQTKEELINALHLAEENSVKLNAIIEAVADGVTVYNQKYETIFNNNAIKNIVEIYGDGELPQDNFKQKIEKLRCMYLDGTIINFEDTGLYRALKKGECVKDFFVMTRSKSGETVYSSNSSAPIRNKNGEITGAVLIHKDITERVELEKKTNELVEKLQKSDQNKNTFINMLSHELRNPLASIMMSLELLEKVPPGGKQAVKALSIAKRQGKQLSHLVDDLLDVTRITQNKIALKKETLEINNLIDNAVQDYQSQFIDKDVKLEVNLTSPLYIEADYSRLTQVISNFLHNAVKFTDKDDLVMISVTEDTNAIEVVITVQDTGRGMDPNDQLNLFEPFTQVDKSLDRKLGGLGLGLSIVKGMVELHGGRVEAFSEGIGKGTKFTIRLPL